MDAAASWWAVRLAAPTYVQQVVVHWRADAGFRSIPESVSLSTSADGVAWTPLPGPPLSPDAMPADHMASPRLAVVGPLAAALVSSVHDRG